MPSGKKGGNAEPVVDPTPNPHPPNRTPKSNEPVVPVTTGRNLPVHGPQQMPRSAPEAAVRELAPKVFTIAMKPGTRLREQFPLQQVVSYINRRLGVTALQVIPWPTEPMTLQDPIQEEPDIRVMTMEKDDKLWDKAGGYANLIPTGPSMLEHIGVNIKILPESVDRLTYTRAEYMRRLERQGYPPSVARKFAKEAVELWRGERNPETGREGLPVNWYQTVLAHEIGHALGLPHHGRELLPDGDHYSGVSVMANGRLLTPRDAYNILSNLYGPEYATEVSGIDPAEPEAQPFEGI